MKPVTLDWAGVSDAEAALVSRCLAGDEPACTELVESHQRMVYQLAFHLLGDKEEALDLSQDVFLTVFRMLDRFRGQSALRTWIYRIVVNQARNRQRWWRRRFQSAQVPLEVHVSEHGELSSPRDDCGPERLLRQKEQADRVWQALRDLPFDQRTALVLREIDGLSYDEIGYSLNVAVGTVKSRLARARQLLRAELQR
jgi:RNA polymerase sigma-70 factor (ECF subfamily)